MLSTTAQAIFQPARIIDPMASRDQQPKLTREIGARLCARRKERGITQIELSKKLGITQAVLSKYERGEIRLTAAIILQITEALGVSADDLLGLKKTPSPQPVPGKRLLRRLSKFEGLPKRQQEALLQTIDAVLKSARS